MTEPTLRIYESADKIGVINWTGEKFVFKGDAEKSAKIFLDHVNIEATKRLRDYAKMEDRLRIKEAYITDAKSKIREMNMGYFGVSSDQLSDLHKAVEKTFKAFDEITETLKKFVDGDIEKQEAREQVERLTNR